MRHVKETHPPDFTTVDETATGVTIERRSPGRRASVASAGAKTVQGGEGGRYVNRWRVDTASTAVGEAAAGVPSRGVDGDVAEPAVVPLTTRGLVDPAAAVEQGGKHGGQVGQGRCDENPNCNCGRQLHFCLVCVGGWPPVRFLNDVMTQRTKGRQYLCGE